MATVPTTTSVNLPVPDHIAKRVNKDRQKEHLAEAGIPFGRLSIYSKSWSVVQPDGTRRFLTVDVPTGGKMVRAAVPFVEVIFVGISKFTSRTYYGGIDFKEEDKQAPICGSINGIEPDVKFGSNRQAKHCIDCKWDQWNTDARKKGKACKQHKVVAVVPSNDMENEADGGALYFRIPTGSMTEWNAFVRKCQNDGGDADMAVASMTIDPEMEGGHVSFQFVRWCTDEECKRAEKWQADPLVDRILYIDYDPDSERVSKEVTQAVADLMTPPLPPAPPVGIAPVAKANGEDKKPSRRVAKSAPPPPPPPPPKKTDEEKLTEYDALVTRAEAAYVKFEGEEDPDEKDVRLAVYNKLKAMVDEMESALVAEGLLVEEEDESTEAAPPASTGSSTITARDLIGSLDAQMGAVPAVPTE